MLTPDEVATLKKRVEEGLSVPIPPEALKDKPGRKDKDGKPLKYVTHGYVAARMDQLFGLAYSKTSQLLEHQISRIDGDWCGYAVCKVTVTLPLWGCVREGIGTCSATKCSSEKQVAEVIFKGAESDALKRAVFSMGPTFGRDLRLGDLDLDDVGTERDEWGEPRRETADRVRRALEESDKPLPWTRDERETRRDERPRRDDWDERPRRDERRRDDRAPPRRDRDWDRDQQRQQAFPDPDREREPINPPKADPGYQPDDPSYDAMTRAGLASDLAKSLATLPSRVEAPRGVMADLFDLGEKLHGSDETMEILKRLGIGSRPTGCEARRFAVAVMEKR